jgi:hypothetical protein
VTCSDPVEDRPACCALRLQAASLPARPEGVVCLLQNVKGPDVWGSRDLNLPSFIYSHSSACVQARERDLIAVTASYDLPAEGLKYIEWRNARTVSKFFYTHRMVKDYFLTLLQDLNKVDKIVWTQTGPNPPCPLTNTISKTCKYDSPDAPGGRSSRPRPGPLAARAQGWGADQVSWFLSQFN